VCAFCVCGICKQHAYALGWFDVKYKVVSVGVGFLNLFVCKLSMFLVIDRLRKFIPLSSYVSLNSKFCENYSCF
jgi:hypothetical protein